MNNQPIPEESLDPQDWEAMKALGHQMVDDMMDYFATLRERPAWQPTPDEVKANLQLPLPHDPQGAESATVTVSTSGSVSGRGLRCHHLHLDAPHLAQNRITLIYE